MPEAGRPDFLKIVYHGPKAMEDLVHYDPHLVGILGGFTTFSAFSLETLQLVQRGAVGAAAAYATASLVLCLLAAALSYAAVTALLR